MRNFLMKTGTLIQHMKNSLNFVSTCLKVVDTRRVVGTYLCVNCFYFDARVSSQECEMGARLKACETCQGTFWILKGR